MSESKEGMENVKGAVNQARSLAQIKYTVESRPIYKQVKSNFDLLTSSYEIVLTQDTEDDLEQLIEAIDLVDSCLDNIDSVEDRHIFTDYLLTFLRDLEVSFPKEVPISLIQVLTGLRRIIHKNHIVTPFSLALESIFSHTESKRTRKTIQSFLSDIKEEGLATAQLPLLIIGDLNNPNFNTMFLAMCQSMGLADLLMDARQDYKLGLSPFKPNLNLYISILRDLVPSGIRIFWNFPNKLNLIRYLGKMVYFLVVGK